MRTLLLASALLAAGLPAGPAAASQRLLALPLGIETAGELRSFGTVRTVLADLRRGDPSCAVSTYERGGTISCGARPGDPRSARVLIDFVAVPTRWPEFAQVEAVRLEGVDSRELPAAERESALARLLGRPARAPRRS